MIICAMMVIGAYVVGAIPIGYLLARLKGVDLTQQGSGSTGASNAWRVLGGVQWFVLVFLLDALKAYGVVKLAGLYQQQAVIFAAIAALLVGNAYSVFLHFRGGKGVATMLGILAALFPVSVVAVFGGCWILVRVIFKIPAVASLSALAGMGLWVWFSGAQAASGQTFSLLFMLSLWIVFCHRRYIVAAARIFYPKRG